MATASTSTLGVAAVSTAKKEQGPPDYKDLKLKSIRVKKNITEHGEIEGINLDNIKEEIKEHINAVRYVGEMDGKYKYMLDLVDLNYIIIEVYKKSMDAIITHFGPFGVKTSVELEQKSSASSLSHK